MLEPFFRSSSMVAKTMLALLIALATAQQPRLDHPPYRTPAGDVAEYRRLSQEIESLAARNAWGGVERIYLDMHATAAPVQPNAHVLGARAAMHRGDVTAARDRLRLAVAHDPTREDASDRLTAIRQEYGAVSLMGDHRVHRLSIEAMPFDPNRARAITFAIAAVDETGTYHGLLPEGTYQFGPHTVEVEPGITSTRIDIRSARTIRREERESRR